MSIRGFGGKLCKEMQAIPDSNLHTSRMVQVPNNKLLMLGGLSSDGNSKGKLKFMNLMLLSSVVCLDGVWEYDLSRLTESTMTAWEQKASMPKAKYGFSTVVFESNIFTFGGIHTRNGNKAIINQVAIYSIKSDTWTAMPTTYRQ